MKCNIFLILIGLLLTLNLSAKSYEDAEDKKVSRWETLNPLSSAIIKSVFDKSKDSRVIELSGDGTKSGYILTINETEDKKLLHWQMKYSEDFVIFISLETKKGRRYLIYTPGDKNGYMQYGLGTEANNGIWHSYDRNLEEDLQYFDNRNSIVKINSFVIRGSGSLDNIKVIKEVDDRREELKKILLDKRLKNKRLKQRVIKSKKNHLKRKNRVTTDTTPVITIEGENPIFLNVGEQYIEPGVSANDKEDGELSVISSENIDKYREGRYAVIYMATDSVGNAAIDKRYVIVGHEEELEEEVEEGSHKEKSIEEFDKASSPSKIDDTDAQYRLEERELEIAEWERELQFREKEISKREKSLEK
jgi:hypothetical protein